MFTIRTLTAAVGLALVLSASADAAGKQGRNSIAPKGMKQRALQQTNKKPLGGWAGAGVEAAKGTSKAGLPATDKLGNFEIQLLKGTSKAGSPGSASGKTPMGGSLGSAKPPVRKTTPNHAESQAQRAQGYKLLFFSENGAKAPVTPR